MTTLTILFEKEKNDKAALLSIFFNKNERFCSNKLKEAGVKSNEEKLLFLDIYIIRGFFLKKRFYP